MEKKSKVKRQKLKVKTEEERLIDRLRRINGQVKGIERMVREEKDCLSVIQQIVAARSALGKVATKILAQESCKLKTGQGSQEFERIINNLIELK